MGTRSTTSSASEITPFRLLFPTIELIVPAGTFLVGREKQSCDIIIRRDSVSRVHCLLTATPTSLQIRDLQSQNGVFVNHQRVHKSDLQVGDRVRIGTARFSVAIDQDTAEGELPPSGERSASDRPARTVRRPSVGDLSRDSIEIPAASPDEDSFDDLPAEDVNVAPAVSEEVHNTAATDAAPPKQPPHRDRKKRSNPLPRRSLPAADSASPSVKTGDDEPNESKDGLHPLLSTTAGRVAVVLAVGWTLYLLVSLLFTGGRGRDRAIARRLSEIGEDVRRLREQSASQDAWDELEANIEAERDSMIDYLEEHASADDPAKQHLLRAARDCLPRMLGVSTKPSWYEERFHEYLTEARSELHME